MNATRAIGTVGQQLIEETSATLPNLKMHLIHLPFHGLPISLQKNS